MDNRKRQENRPLFRKLNIYITQTIINIHACIRNVYLK